MLGIRKSLYVQILLTFKVRTCIKMTLYFKLTAVVYYLIIVLLIFSQLLPVLSTYRLLPII